MKKEELQRSFSSSGKFYFLKQGLFQQCYLGTLLMFTVFHIGNIKNKQTHAI